MDDCEAMEKSTLKYLMNLNTYAMGSVHPVWDLARTGPHTSFSANIRVKLLVQRYPLSGNQTTGRHMSAIFKLCVEEKETT